MDDLFLIEEPALAFMNKDEYFKKSQQLFDIISMQYSKSWKSRRLLDSEFPDESICEKCKGCGVFNVNGEEKECVQDKEEGDCFHRFFDSEEFGLEVESQLEELHNLLGLDGLTA